MKIQTQLLVFAISFGTAKAQTHMISDYYYPLKAGNEWVYAEPDTGSTKATIIRVVETNELVTCYSNCSPVLPYLRSLASLNFIQADESAAGFFDVRNSWTNYMPGGHAGWGWVGIDHAEGRRWRFEPGLIFTDGFLLGEVVSKTNTVYDHGVCAGQGTFSVQLVGFADVQVPAGLFPNCMHLKLAYNILGTIREEDHWWAKDVGPVKFTHGGGGSFETNELKQFTVRADTPSFAWAKRVASTVNPDRELAAGLAIDSTGNLYVTGWFDGTNDLGNGVVLTNSPGGGQDVFIAKYSSAGLPLWARRGGSSTPEWDAGRGIGVDDAGNVYVTGQFYGEADFDGSILSGSDESSFFLTKYDSDGGIEWARQSMGDWTHYGIGLAVDGAGNCYVAGYIEDFLTITFDEDTSVTNTNDAYGSFLVKYDSGGDAKWATLIGSPGQTYSTSTAVDGNGNVYVSGAFHGNLFIGNTNLTSTGAEAAYLAKFSSAGHFQWVRLMNTTSYGGDPSGVCADAFGNVYVAGGFGTDPGDTICFGPSAVGSPICLTNIGGGLPEVGIGDAFLVKYDGSTGTAQWAVRAGETNADFNYSVTTDSQGNVFTTGGRSGFDSGSSGLSGLSAVVAKYDSNGVPQWAVSSAETGAVAAFAPTVVDAAGNCYLAGWFQTNAVFGTNALTGLGYWDFFLAKVGTEQLPLALGIQWDNPLPLLSVAGGIGTRFVLEYASTVSVSTSWQPLLTNTLSSSPFLYWDGTAEDVSSRFYRARLLP